MNISENKLNKLKGRSAHEVSPKEMVRCLSDAREAHMQRHLASSAETSYASHFADTDSKDLNSDSSALTNLQRRMHPEKQALTTEELKALVENDELEKVAREIAEDESSRTQIVLHPRHTFSAQSSREQSKDSSDTDDKQDTWYVCRCMCWARSTDAALSIKRAARTTDNSIAQPMINGATIDWWAEAQGFEMRIANDNNKWAVEDQ